MQVRRIPGWTPDDSLEHKAIKGQKKGVRRYQYANGTYTAAGNARYRPKKGIVSRLTGINFTDNAFYLIGVGAAAAGVALAAGAISLPAAGTLTTTFAGKGAISALMANETFRNIVLPAIGTMSIANIVDKLLDDELDHSDIDEYLEHHGIKGMKWGVRRYQYSNGKLTPEGEIRYGVKGLDTSERKDYTSDDDRRVLAKGSVVSNVSQYRDQKLESKRALYVYDQVNEMDRLNYEGAYSVFIRKYRGGQVWKQNYEATKDLVIATKKDQVDAFVEMYKDKKVGDLVKKELEAKQKRIEQSGIVPTMDYENRQKTDMNDPWQVYIDIFDRFPNSNYKSNKIFEKKLKKMGFDGRLDYNNVKVYNGAETPTLIFDQKKSLKKAGPSEALNDQDIVNNYNELMKKIGRRPLL